MPPQERRKRPAGNQGALENSNNDAAANTRKRTGTQDLKLRADVVQLHRLGPFATFDLLVELGERQRCRAEIKQLASLYARLDPRLLRAVGRGWRP